MAATKVVPIKGGKKRARQTVMDDIEEATPPQPKKRYFGGTFTPTKVLAQRKARVVYGAEEKLVRYLCREVQRNVRKGQSWTCCDCVGGRRHPKYTLDIVKKVVACLLDQGFPARWTRESDDCDSFIHVALPKDGA